MAVYVAILFAICVTHHSSIRIPFRQSSVSDLNKNLFLIGKKGVMELETGIIANIYYRFLCFLIVLTFYCSQLLWESILSSKCLIYFSNLYMGKNFDLLKSFLHFCIIAMKLYDTYISNIFVALMISYNYYQRDHHYDFKIMTHNNMHINLL